MKKALQILLLVAVTMMLFGCQGTSESENVLRVGATPVPHVELLNQVKDQLADQGITLEIVEFTDYVKPNLSLNDGEIDVNFFQHLPYLEDFNEERGLDLVSVAGIHVEPMGLYSEKIKSLDALTDGAVISIPNDAVNGGRALLLLQAQGLVTIDPAAGLEATEADITDNPKGLVIQAIEAAQLPRTLADVDAAVINGNYAIEAGFNPIADALILEGGDSPYVNILTTRADNADDPKVQALVEAMQTEAIQAFIEETYQGAVVAAFTE
jgi:D-methionine transport system substrate-binding protein